MYCSSQQRIFKVKTQIHFMNRQSQVPNVQTVNQQHLTSESKEKFDIFQNVLIFFLAELDQRIDSTLMYVRHSQLILAQRLEAHLFNPHKNMCINNMTGCCDRLCAILFLHQLWDSRKLLRQDSAMKYHESGFDSTQERKEVFKCLNYSFK